MAIEIKREQFLPRKTMSPFTGQEYVIRRVSFRQFLEDIGLLPMAVVSNVAEQLAKLSKDLKERAEKDSGIEERVRRWIIEHGVVEPKIWFGDEDQCPDDQIAYADMGDDARLIAGEIAEWSFEFAGLKLDNFFRDARPVAARPDGAEVRRETVEPSAKRNN